jgi:Ca-activated chloride channel family protein
VFPDLYRGEPLVIAAKLAKLDGTLEVRGMVGERPWIVTLPLSGAAEGQGLSKLWARRKIADLEVARTTQEVAPEEADRGILALALDHHLVTRLSSLIAIDKTPSRPENAHLSRAELPLNLPAGWEFEKVFGEKGFGGERRPAVAPDTRRADNGAYAQIAAALAPSAKPLPAYAGAPVQAGVVLPKTATDAELRLLAGLALCLTSLLLFALRRRAARAGARF